MELAGLEAFSTPPSPTHEWNSGFEIGGVEESYGQPNYRLSRGFDFDPNGFDLDSASFSTRYGIDSLLPAVEPAPINGMPAVEPWNPLHSRGGVQEVEAFTSYFENLARIGSCNGSLPSTSSPPTCVDRMDKNVFVGVCVFCHLLD